MSDDGEKTALYFMLFLGAVAVVQIFRNRSVAATDAGSVSFTDTNPESVARGALEILAPMKLSPTGAAFIKQNEGLRLNRYTDNGKSAIGYGHDYTPNDPVLLQVTGSINPSSITKQQAEQIFQIDTDARANTLNSLLKVTVNQNQFDAMMDLLYNIGIGNFQNSTLLRMVNNGNFAGAAKQFQVWRGNQGRRSGEANLFSGGAATS